MGYKGGRELQQARAQGRPIYVVAPEQMNDYGDYNIAKSTGKVRVSRGGGLYGFVKRGGIIGGVSLALMAGCETVAPGSLGNNIDTLRNTCAPLDKGFCRETALTAAPEAVMSTGIFASAADPAKKLPNLVEWEFEPNDSLAVQAYGDKDAEGNLTSLRELSIGVQANFPDPAALAEAFPTETPTNAADYFLKMCAHPDPAQAPAFRQAAVNDMAAIVQRAQEEAPYVPDLATIIKNGENAYLIAPIGALPDDPARVNIFVHAQIPNSQDLADLRCP